MSTSIPPVLQLAATLSLLASGSFQHNVGNDFLLGMCQGATCKIANRVAKEIERKLCPQHIQFSVEDSSLCMEAFFTKFKIPGGLYIKYFYKLEFILHAFTFFIHNYV